MGAQFHQCHLLKEGNLLLFLWAPPWDMTETSWGEGIRKHHNKKRLSNVTLNREPDATTLIHFHSFFPVPFHSSSSSPFHSLSSLQPGWAALTLQCVVTALADHQFPSCWLSVKKANKSKRNINFHRMTRGIEKADSEPFFLSKEESFRPHELHHRLSLWSLGKGMTAWEANPACC